MPPTPPVPALGYVRVSTSREEMVSPRIQETAITDWAARNNRKIIEWISDLNKSGRNFQRKILNGIARVEAGEVKEIIVYHYDRWGRNLDASLINLARVKEAGGAVISVTEPLDTTTPIGEYARSNSLALARMQSRMIGEGWKAALSGRVADRLPATGGPRFGYRRLGRFPDPVEPHRFRRDLADTDGERYEPDPETGPVLAEMYERYARGDGSTSILRWLNESAIPTTRGGTWTDWTLLCVLDSGFGAGLLRVRGPGCRCKKALNRCEHILHVPGSQEPVISRELWETYRRRRERMRDDHAVSKRAVYPLSGLLFCGECGHSLTISGIRGQQGYAYRCQRWTQHRGCKGAWVRRDLAEQAVLGRLAEWAADTEAAARVAQARTSAVAGAQAERARLIRYIAHRDRALAKIVKQQAMDDVLPAESYETAKAGLLAERAAAAKALEAAADRETANRGDYQPVIIGLLQEWDTLAASARREVLGKLISRIVVTRTAPRRPPRIEIIPVWDAEGTGRGTL